ncbi:MAG: carboxypeptidase regulatory-like domain-containing protein, partial [Acidobacteria bacterium]|nr:carboxypeptidase regulatory-like domain-containing protein [Acidobacteriota bacterium]
MCHNSTSLIGNCLRICGLACLVPVSVLAQSFTASIVGTVLDQSAASVPDAAVKVTNTGTNAVFTFTTDQRGNYSIPQLRPGSYRLEVEATGFQKHVRDGITLEVNQVARIDVKLALGQVTEAIAVTGGAPLLETESASMGEVVDERKVQNLPLEGRNPLSLLALTPGAAVGAEFGAVPGQENFIVQGNFRLSGGQDLTNEILIDGIPSNAASYGQPGYIPSLDAVQEFKVQTFALAAEFGHTGGGVVNITTRSGSNDLHGSAFWYHRNDVVAARNFFSLTKPPKLISNQPGFTVGGPVIRNKTFFFGQFEPFRRRYGLPKYLSVPTAAQRRGDFRNFVDARSRSILIYDPQTTRSSGPGAYIRDPFPGNIIPENRIEPNTAKILKFVPLPNQPGIAGSNVDNYFSGASGKVDQNQFNIRIDHNLSDSRRLSGRVGYSSINDEYPNLLGSIADDSRGRYPEARNAMIEYTDTLSPRLLLSLRAGFSRQVSTRRSPGASQDAPAQIGFPSSIPDVVFPRLAYGFGTIGSPNDNGFETGNTYSTQANFTRISGRHTLKGGIDFRVEQFNWYRPGWVSGSLSFGAEFTRGPDPFTPNVTRGHSFATFLLGIVSASDISNAPAMAYEQKYLAGYLQDDFRVNRKLTLNLGMRYDLIHPFTERYNRVAQFDRNAINPLTNTPGMLKLLGRDGLPRGARGSDLNNWGPRIGFAYSLFSRTVLRSGYGIFYTQPPWNGGGYDRAATSGYFARETLTALDPITPLPWGLANPFPGGPPPLPTPDNFQQYMLGLDILFIDRSDRTPYMQIWNFGLQHELLNGLLIDASYSGSKGTHLQAPISYPENQLTPENLKLGNALFERVPNPFAGRISGSLGAPTITRQQLLRPYPQYQSVNTNLKQFGSSTYHSLQLKIERRFAAGLSLLVG